MKELFYTVIPNFTNSIIVANKVRIKPYRKGFKTPALPLKYSKLIDVLYFWDKKGYLINGLGELVASNSKKAGLPRIWIVNFQDLYNGKLNPFSVNSYIQKMKDYLLPYIEDMAEIHDEDDLKLELRFYIQKKANWTNNIDIDNMSALWFKASLDCLKGTVIKDDHPFIITGTKALVYFVEEHETKLEIRLWKS
jgi:hypothetical protein